MRKNDLSVILILNIVLVALIALGNSDPTGLLEFVRLVLGLGYLLFVPGYVLQAALLPHQGRLTSLDRTALSFGLSIGVIPILGLALDGPLGGIFLWQSTIFLTSFTVICILVVLIRRQRMGKINTELENGPAGLSYWWKSLGTVSKLLAMAMSCGVLIASGLLIFVILSPSPDKQFTEFYMVSPRDVAAGYPLSVAAGQQFPIKLSVVNQEGLNVTYSIQAQMNGQTLAGTAPFTLSDGQSISLDLTLSASTPGDNQMLEILLLRDNQIYRRLYLWLNVKSP